MILLIGMLSVGWMRLEGALIIVIMTNSLALYLPQRINNSRNAVWMELQKKYGYISYLDEIYLTHTVDRPTLFCIEKMEIK